MKEMMKLAVAIGVLASATAQGLAQTTVTDSAQEINVSLNGYVQDGTANALTATRVRVTTKDIAGLLGGTAKSRLVLLTPVDYDGEPFLVLREKSGRTIVDTDVTGALTSTTLALVENSRMRGNRDAGTEYSIDTFNFAWGEESPTTLELQGFTTASKTNGSFKSSVNGTGNVNGAPGVFTGTISAKGGKEEARTIEEPPIE
jgi:hypothetical protein